jgi:C-terminal processing protease CtpA/Prc
VVEKLAALLAEHYVVPETGGRYAELLRRNAAGGRYNGLPAAQLAKMLTDDLQAAAKDGHLRIIAPGAVTPHRMVMGGGTGAIEAGRWIADGVAYLRLGILPGNPEGVAAIEQFLQEHAEARSLIVDIRNTPGGAGETGQLIMSYLFGRSQPLLRMEVRNESFAAGWTNFLEGPSIRRIEAPAGFVTWERRITPHATERRLHDAQVLYLTSRRTGSAAEAMAFALKRTKRATLIGENTYGAGYFTRLLELGSGFSVNLSIGRTFDPDTGAGFEGTGVAPDVPVLAAQALDEALRRAGVTDPQKIAAAVALAE